MQKRFIFDWKPDYNILLFMLLYLLLGAYLNKRHILSLFQRGHLEISIHYIIMSSVFLFIAFSYPAPWTLFFPQFIDSAFMQALYMFFFPLYKVVKGNIIMILLGYFLAGIFRKIPQGAAKEAK